MASANLVSNGNFETLNSAYSNTGIGYDPEYTGSMKIDNWSVTGSVDIVSATEGIFPVIEGEYSIALAGTPAPGKITQSMNLGAGMYRLSWDVISNGQKKWAYFVNADTTYNYLSPQQMMGVQNETFDFYHAGGLLNLEFGTTYNGYQGPIIDNVSLEAVPEPATMAVLGMGALGLLRRRNKKS
jgi:hypothetical protein